jgi:glycosyltransferase involved in cell wall biosynthesis
VRRVVFVTQEIDPAHATLAAAAAKVRALAERVDEVVVLASRAAPAALPENARFHSFAAPNRGLRGARFASALGTELARGRPAAVIAHMSPVYAVLAAPLARPLRVPVLLWFTHWRASSLLRLAERLSTAVLSVDRTTFPLESGKVVATGHGIDVDAFPCVEAPSATGVRLVALGRYSPAKGLPTVVRAMRLVLDEGIEARLDLHGPAQVPGGDHRRELETLARDLGVSEAVGFHGPLPHHEVPNVLARADALVNNMRPGAADKVVFEAAAACRPAFAAAHAFEGLLPDELRFPSDDAEALARRVVALFRTSPAYRFELGRELREKVRVEHSVDHWADAILAVAGR